MCYKWSRYVYDYVGSGWCIRLGKQWYSSGISAGGAAYRIFSSSSFTVLTAWKYSLPGISALNDFDPDAGVQTWHSQLHRFRYETQ
jgi:hypothetical protein